LFPDGYLDYTALTAALQRLSMASAGRVHLKSLTKTREGRDVWLATVSLPVKSTSGAVSVPSVATVPASPSTRPAILVVANLEADHVVGSQVALRILEEVSHEPSWEKRLGDCSIYVVPRLNPDGAERLFHTPRVNIRTNLEPLDRDRDGQAGEDGPDDLNGDGLISMMRVKDGKATLIPDSADPRFLQKADASKGERPVYSEYAEGLDNDNDGQVNEDAPGGVNLNRNWPYRWSEFDPEAGFSPVAEPETRALVQFVFDHPEIVVIWTFSLNDNLTIAPRKPEASYDAVDLPIFAELSRLYGKAANKIAPGQVSGGSHPAMSSAGSRDKLKGSKAEVEQGKKSGTPPALIPAKPNADKPSEAKESTPAAKPPLTAPASPGATTDGALSEWAYHHAGVIGLASRLWEGPELPDTVAGGVVKGPSTEAPVPGDGELRWLSWNDQIMGGRAFVPFARFNHPTLGQVDLGGWKPGVRLNPPIEQIAPIARVNQAFLEELSSRLPRLAIRDVKVQAMGQKVYQITAAVVNEGQFPTALVQGTKSRKAPPIRLRLDVGPGRLLAGPARSQFDSLGGSGGRREFRWLVLSPEVHGEKTRPFAILLHVTSPKAGMAVQTIPIGTPK
jgi:murein tripeptide amidase MpaA